jgi:arabinofuranosyltransferase
MSSRIIKTEAVFWWSCLVVAIAVTAIHNWSIRPWMLDDSFISFRYAENWARGLGMVYNAGERVEGYTSFLWVMLLGLGRWIGCDTVVLARVLGGIFTGGTLLVLAYSYRLISSISRTEAGMAALFAGTCAIFTPWLSSGMEVSLVTFLILAMVLVYRADLVDWSDQKRTVIAGLLGALTIMARPEGVLIVALLGLHVIYRFIRCRERASLWFLLAAFVVYAPYFVWRFSYYGYLLPNTFYAKVGFTVAQLARGGTYGLQGVLACAPLIALALVSLAGRSSADALLRYLLLAGFAMQLAFVVIVGGDVMPAFRFLAPVIPLLALAAAIGAVSVTRRWSVVLMFVLIPMGYNLAEMSFAPKIAGHIQSDHVAFHGKAVGLWLHDHVAPGTVLATNTAGSIAYYSELPIIDMLGLNDVHIAHRALPSIGEGTAGHEKGDGAYVLSRLPSLVQFRSSLGSVAPAFRSDSELYASQVFQAEYSAIGVPMPELQMVAVFYARDSFQFVSR